MFLPFDVHAHFGFVHKQNERQAVFNQHRKQHHQQLFFATRQLVRLQRFANLRETHFVLGAYDGLSRFGKQAVNHVLKHALGLVVRLRHTCRIGSATLQGMYDAIADVYLIIQVSALQLIELKIQFGSDAQPQFGDNLGVEQRAVERTDDVVAYARGVFGLHRDVHALHMALVGVAPLGQTLHHSV